MSKIKSEGPFSSLEIESNDASWSVKGCLSCIAKDTEIAALKAELAETRQWLASAKEAIAAKDKEIQRLRDGLRRFADLENWLYCNPRFDGETIEIIKWVGEDDPMILAKALLEGE